MLAYTVALVVTTLVLVPVADLGWIYGVSAAVLGAMFIGGTIALGRAPTPAASMRLFGYSHHLRDAAVRRADPRRVRPVRLVKL